MSEETQKQTRPTKPKTRNVSYRLRQDLFDFYEQLAKNERRKAASEAMKLALEDRAIQLGFKPSRAA